VDDEEVVLKTALLMLEKSGFRVTACREAQEALALFRDARGSIDLVLMDLMMPGLTGKELFTAFRQIHPAVRVLLASGFSQEGEAQEILDAGAQGFIPKPFLRAELAQKVSEALGELQPEKQGPEQKA
jgi:CheY-like chemotaxis protein